jgi:hypothetical protein
MTGTPARLQRSTTSFWMAGTSARESSTPRSPRATMTASTQRRMALSCRIASTRSSFATTGVRSPCFASARRQAWTSSAPRTKDSAT